MINETMNKAFNDQINAELYSAYLYLSMNAYFEEQSLTGFANWMKIQVQEEMAHAMGMYDYLNSRDGHIILEQIDKPVCTWNSALEVFEAVLRHEEHVTSLINKLADVAEEQKDRASMQFINWYIKEQVEEEATAKTIVDKLKMAGNDTNALLLLDAELGARTYNAPVIE